MAKKINTYLFFILSGVILIACDNGRLNQRDYLTLMSSEASCLSSSQSLNNINFRCVLQTPELITLRRNGINYKDRTSFENDKRDYENLINFVFIIKDEGMPGKSIVKNAVLESDIFNNIMAYSNEHLNNDFEIELSDGSKIPCSLVHLEPSNSIHPIIRITGSFKFISPKPEELTLIFNDNFFNTGKLKFHFNKRLFEQIPQLII